MSKWEVERSTLRAEIETIVIASSSFKSATERIIPFIKLPSLITFKRFFYDTALLTTS